MKNISTEVLWRIKDAEELIKSRVSEVKVMSIFNELKVSLNGSVQVASDLNKVYVEERIRDLQLLMEKEKSNNETVLSDFRLIVKG